MNDTLSSFGQSNKGSPLKIGSAMGGALINTFLSRLEREDKKLLGVLRYFSLEERGGRVYLRTTDREWGEKLMSVIREKFGDMNGSLVVQIEEPRREPEKVRAEGLNPKYTFDNFVVGEGNRLAYQVAMDVARGPGITFNPFFLYGNVGLGKTHLLQAIGNHCCKNGLSVVYRSANDFSEEMVDYLKRGKIREFRSRYRKADVFLLDDVQFLSGKDRTQIEFFNIFNHMYMNEKQIILASDRHPKDLKDVSDRLVSRFEGGVVVEIEMDPLTKVEIIKKKLEEMKIDIRENLVKDLASKTRDNVREIEGVVRALKIGGKPRLVEGNSSGDLFRVIREVVASHFDVESDQITKLGGSRRVNRARHVAMYLSRVVTGSSLIEIARAFGRRDHSTVIYAIKKIEKEKGRDRKFALVLEFLEKKVREKIKN